MQLINKRIRYFVPYNSRRADVYQRDLANKPPTVVAVNDSILGSRTFSRNFLPASKNGSVLSRWFNSCRFADRRWRSPARCSWNAARALWRVVATGVVLAALLGEPLAPRRRREPTAEGPSARPAPTRRPRFFCVSKRTARGARRRVAKLRGIKRTVARLSQAPSANFFHIPIRIFSIDLEPRESWY